MSIGSDHAGRTDGALSVDVLVAVKEPPRVTAGHVAVEATEPDVNVIVAVVDQVW
jgi:hypothetical protein